VIEDPFGSFPRARSSFPMASKAAISASTSSCTRSARVFCHSAFVRVAAFDRE